MNLVIRICCRLCLLAGSVMIHFFSEGRAADFAPLISRFPNVSLHLGSWPNASMTTARDLDLITLADVLIGGWSSFFTMAAHLCDKCVIVTPRRYARYAFSPSSGVPPEHHQVLDIMTLTQDTFAQAWTQIHI